MNMLLVELFSFSILIAAVIAAVRFRKMDASYRPFVYLLWTGLANEIVTFLLVSQRKSNAVNNNVYYLAESLLVLYQFRTWRLFERSVALFSLLLCGFVGVWITEVFVFASLREFASYFIVFYAFSLSLCSVAMINQLLGRETNDLFKKAEFLICAGFLLYFTNAAFVELFYLYGNASSHRFQLYVTRILVFINLFTNLLYAVAVLWIPKKESFSF